MLTPFRLCLGVVLLLPVGASAQPDNPLFKRMAANDLAGVKKLLADDPNLANEPTSNKYYPLSIAARQNDVDMVRALVDAGAKLDAPDPYGRTPLIDAAWHGRRPVVELLLARGANVNAGDQDRLTPLHRAAGLGHVEVVAALLARGADPEGGCDGKAIRPRETPLFWAVRSGYYEVAELLLMKGAKVDGGHPHDRNPPLRVAAENGDADLVRLLLARGADPNGYYAFDFALWRKHRDVIELFLAHNIDVKNPNYLASAAGVGNKEVVERLLGLGAPVNGKNVADQTPLAAAAAEGRPEIVALLLMKRADVNAEDHEGATPLHRATREDVVEMLLARGADPNAVARDGTTPLHRAASRRIAERLVGKGASVDVADKQGATPLVAAVHAGDRERAEFLAAKGARHTLDTAAALGRVDVLRKLLDEQPLPKENPGLRHTALHLAAQFNPPEAAALLLDRGLSVNAIGLNGLTPLHLAAKHGHKDMAALLVGRKADLNARTTGRPDTFTARAPGRTPLEMALGQGRLEAALFLMSKGALPKVDTVPAATGWLQEAAGMGQVDVAAYFLGKGALIDDPGPDVARNPLHLAVESGNLDMITLLLDKGAKIDLKDRYQETPLLRAVKLNRQAVAALLLKRGADPDLGGPLAVAAQAGRRDVAEVLIRGKASVAAALLPAVQADDLGVVKLLLDSGASPKQVPEALHAAALGGRLPIAELLVARGAGVNAATLHGSALYYTRYPKMPGRFRYFVDLDHEKFKDLKFFGYQVKVGEKHGWLVSGTPLQAAVAGRHPGLVKWLLGKGAAVDARFPGGGTALHLAAHLGDVDTLEVLLAAGADLAARDGAGAMALQTAVAAGRDEAAKWLRARGAKK
jgi:ankyrin repeat protein